MENNKDEIRIEKAEMIRETMATEYHKRQIIRDIRMMGEKIKKNPNGVKIIQKTWWEKFKLSLRNIFTKF